MIPIDSSLTSILHQSIQTVCSTGFSRLDTIPPKGGTTNITFSSMQNPITRPCCIKSLPRSQSRLCWQALTLVNQKHQRFRMQHDLYFLPLPQEHGSFRPILTSRFRIGSTFCFPPPEELLIASSCSFSMSDCCGIGWLTSS